MKNNDGLNWFEEICCFATVIGLCVAVIGVLNAPWWVICVLFGVAIMCGSFWIGFLSYKRRREKNQ